jgi:uncharacterized membrane protein
MKNKFLACFLMPVACVAAVATGDSVETPRSGETGQKASASVERRRPHGQRAVWHSIDFPAGTGTVALDISAAGEIVGSYNDISGTHGFRRSRTGEFESIDIPGSNFTRVAGINSSGDVVGTYRLATDLMTARHGFLLRDGEFTTIDPPGAVFTNPLGINSAGDIVGRFCTTLPCTPEGTNVHGFLLRDGAFSVIDVPMSNGTNAWKINARGDIVGGYTDADGSRKIFTLRLRERDYSTVDVFGAGEPRLDNGGINSRGEIVGSYCEVTPCQGDAQSFLLALSSSAFERISFPGSIRTNAFGINSRGDIVGTYEDATGAHGFLLTRRERRPLR